MDSLNRFSDSSSDSVDAATTTTTATTDSNSRPSGSVEYNVRSPTPSSWYATLATDPPRAEDFIIYDDPDAPPTWISQVQQEDIEVSDKLPSAQELSDAADLPVLDANGKERPFKSLYWGPQNVGKRQLIIFVRHFFCQSCQSYVQKLNETIPDPDGPDALDTTVTLIACGSPKLIAGYKQWTNTHFRVFTDPSRKLFKALGCKEWVFNWGSQSPEYPLNVLKICYTTIGNFIKQGKVAGAFKAGHFFQVGGEFLFEQGELAWCHRMQSIRGYSKLKTIRRVLSIADDMQDDGAAASSEGSAARRSSRSTDGNPSQHSTRVQQLSERLESQHLGVPAEAGEHKLRKKPSRPFS